MFCWFKFTSLTSASTLGGGLVTTHWHGTNSGTGITIRYVSSTTGYLSVNTGNGSSRTYNTYYGTTLLQANTWYHGGFTYDGTNIKIYVNGNLEKTQAYANMSMPENYIGVHCWSLHDTTPHANYKFIGSINDVRIYDHCLSAAEVREIAQGLVLHYKLDGGAIGNPNLLPNSKLDGTWTYPSSSYSDKYSPITNIIPSGTQYTLSFDAKSTVDGDKIRTHYYSPNTTTTCISSQGITKTAADGNMDFTLSTNWKRYWVVYTQTSTTAVKHVICPRLVSGQGSGTISVKNVKLEEGSAATAWRLAAEEPQILIEDSSGYRHNGEIVNTLTTSSNTPRYEMSTHFSNSAHIKTLNFDFLTNIWTVSCWYYRDTNPSAFEAIFCLSKGNGGDANKKIAAIPNTGRIWFKGESGSLSISKLNISAWTMLTMTCDGTTVTIYENGSVIGSFSANSQMTGCTDLVIGARANSANAASIAVPYTGGISDFRIYCTALSADDILQLYHTSAKIDNKSNIHTYEINEHGANKLTKTGTLYDNIDESTIMTLPDGSHWRLLMYHLVNGGKNLFSSTNCMECNEFGLFSRLKYIDNYMFDNKYEFYVIQDGTTYRWTQTSAPFSTSSVSGFAAVSGFNSPGSGICRCTNYTLLARTSSTNNWWNAIGCYHEYNGGIPGFNSIVCKENMALYVRVDDDKAKLSNSSAHATEFIEF